MSDGENQKIIEGVTSQHGPYVALYGDAHRAQLIEGLNATSVGILASEKDAYQGMVGSLPEYIYYTDSDRLLHIPAGSRERAEFQASHVTGPIYGGIVATGVALTDAEKQACMDALAAEVRGKPVSFPAVPPAPINDFTGPTVRPRNGVTNPVVVSQVPPKYDEQARVAKIEGSVLLSLVVDESGAARNIKVVRSLAPGLDQKAIEAVRQWKFRPGQKDGNPVAVQAQIQVTFRLPDKPLGNQ
jgi:TonB family protein